MIGKEVVSDHRPNLITPSTSYNNTTFLISYDENPNLKLTTQSSFNPNLCIGEK
jgi:phospholipase C